MSFTFDVAIVGAGIVGLATGVKISEAYPGLRICIIEKESGVARHQTGHNSGVIHSGIYYKPGSFKALLCVAGARELVSFCRSHDIPHEICGKVVVAATPEEIPRLHELYRRGTANSVPGLKLLSPEEVKQFEPHVACLQGMHVPTTGIVDFSKVAEAFAGLICSRGGTIFFGHRLLAISSRSEGSRAIRLETSQGSISTDVLINCGGLYSDRVAEMAGLQPPCRIVPFRGEYYQIEPSRSGLVNGLIYPVPDPRFPFLGVHFTRMIDGKVEAGPNAVLAWAREGYTKSSVSPAELLVTLGYQGFWRLALRYWKPAWHEMIRSYSKSRFTHALRQLIPEIGIEDLRPGGAGVRAQALGADGALLDDFVVLQKNRMVHVLNAPSPAATSSLAIAEHIMKLAAPLLTNRS